MISLLVFILSLMANFVRFFNVFMDSEDLGAIY